MLKKLYISAGEGEGGKWNIHTQYTHIEQKEVLFDYKWTMVSLYEETDLLSGGCYPLASRDVNTG